MKLKRKTFLMLLSPAMFVLVIVAFIPFILCVNNSFRFYDLTKPQEGTPWIGVKNYSLLFQDSRFWHSLQTTLIFTIFSVGVELIVAFILASLLNKLEKGSLLVPLFTIPMVIPPVVVGLTWRLMYDHTLGIINYFLKVVGLAPQSWLGSESLALFSIILTDVWEWTPLVFLIIFAGMKSLPREPFEAAEIDGASGFQITRYITLPLLKQVALVGVLLRTIDAFKWFDTIYIMTNGGPGIATETASLYSYLIAFNFFNIGKGSAFAVVLLIIVTLFCTFYTKILPEEETI